MQGKMAQFLDIVRADPAYQTFAGGVVDASFALPSGLARGFNELWFNVRPILLEVGLPALLMGFSFPLGNATKAKTPKAAPAANDEQH